MPTVVALACAVAAPAAPALTTIQDVLYKADGSRFNGTVQFTWTNFQAADNSPIPTQGITVNVVSGALKVRLVPTTNASSGASYSVRYSSQGMYQFTETWAVPPSTAVLRVRDVRVGTGTTVGPPPVLTEVMISDVTGLTDELNARSMKGSAYSPSRTAIINSGGLLDAATGNLGDCVHVDGTSGPCGSSGSSSNVVYADGETPAGLVNGVNSSFTLNNAPSPAAGLMFYRNGILMKQSNDYTLNGNIVTFYTAAIPGGGDLLTASYRYLSAATSSSLQYVDSETPSGPVNGSNTSLCPQHGAVTARRSPVIP